MFYDEYHHGNHAGAFCGWAQIRATIPGNVTRRLTDDLSAD
jgi:hypothetical protein